MSNLIVPRRVVGKLGRKEGVSEIGSQVKLKDFLIDPKDPRAVADPFPFVSPTSNVDFSCGVSSWGEFGNNIYGDCTWAGRVHGEMANAWFDGTQPVGNLSASVWPSTAQVDKGYFTYNGSPNGAPLPQYDTGCDMGQLLLYFMKNGIGPIEPLEAFVQVDITNPQEYMGAHKVGGGLYAGLMVSNEMMTQSQNGEPWTSLATDWAGGHCVWHVARNAQWGRCITWGMDQLFSWANWQATRQEAYLLVTKSMAAAKGGIFNGINISAIIKACQALGGQV